MTSQIFSPSRRRRAQYQRLIASINALVGAFAVQHPPVGVRPAVFINDVNVHEGIPCKLCQEEKVHNVPQLVAPQLGYTDYNRDRYCKHVYATSREAYFCWNKNGSLHLRRVNGSGEHRYPDNSVVLYQPGEDMMGMPFSAPPSFVGEGEQRARCESYYEMLFQFLHPYSSRRIAEQCLRCIDADGLRAGGVIIRLAVWYNARSITPCVRAVRDEEEEIICG
ncbi:hypothetical protein PENSPDRAFT_758678 [Peniophora sp. CONT]|nr:hypothetical protein PENSPDRAFT_758678 [Peniophora sp. CONT]